MLCSGGSVNSAAAKSLPEKSPPALLVTGLLPRSTVAPLIGSATRSCTRPLTVIPCGGGVGPLPAHATRRPRVAKGSVVDLRSVFMVSPSRERSLAPSIDQSQCACDVDAPLPVVRVHTGFAEVVR